MRKIAAVLAMLLLIMAFTGCQKSDGQTTGTTAPAPAPESSGQTEPTVEPTYPPAPENMVAVTTSFGQLFYQDQWLELMHIEQKLEGQTLTVEFYGTVEGEHYPLFNFIIGDYEGEPVGTMTDLQGTQRTVYIQMLEMVDISQLEDTHQDRLYAMKEELNIILENLK